MKIIDFRSDTVTKPSQQMLQAMLRSPVGDDVYGEDPTVDALEKKMATLLGHEASLFVPSGTMANQIAVGLHTVPGDEILCEGSYHLFTYEGGAAARLWGASMNILHSPDHFLRVEDVNMLVRPDDPHFPRTKLLWLENTTNRGGGRVYPYEEIVRLRKWSQENQLSMHLDGARLMNAVVASGISAADWGKNFDSVSFCFSKGLGCPVGSVFASSALNIRTAKRFRKILGGGMRQAGILAGACLYALDHNVQRLKEDHSHARSLAQKLQTIECLKILGPVETNIMWFEVDAAWGASTKLAEKLKEKGILCNSTHPQLFRLCTHLDIQKEDIDEAFEIFQNILK